MEVKVSMLAEASPVEPGWGFRLPGSTVAHLPAWLTGGDRYNRMTACGDQWPGARDPNVMDRVIWSVDPTFEDTAEPIRLCAHCEQRVMDRIGWMFDHLDRWRRYHEDRRRRDMGIIP